MNFDFENKVYVMGILNITPDSFSDGGENYSLEKAIIHGKKMVEDGVDIIDVGGESTRPGSDPVSLEEELARVIPLIKRLVEEVSVPISIDTYKAQVAKEALEAGATIINDVSGFKMDRDMAKVAGEKNAYSILMHMRGTPKSMQQDYSYRDLLGEVEEELQESIDLALEAGVTRDRLILDPGIGFAKGLEENVILLNNIERLKKRFNLPVLIGASRKKFIGTILNIENPKDRLEGSLAVAAIGAYEGAAILRVHDVKETARVVKLANFLRNYKK
ncbi:MAG: dihydropteroate synthase [Cetobacterium sp.]|uniref:dihydropteroate synthase n=1 Tax=Cetobacterium sp. TaxID=2071632 RepID=UPI003F2E2CF6